MERNYRWLYRRGPNTEQNNNFSCHSCQYYLEIPFANIETMHKVLIQMSVELISCLILRGPAVFIVKIWKTIL